MLSYISKSVYFAILFFQFIFPTTVTVAQSLDEIISGEHRSDQNKIRNEARHPKETLEFFGLEKTMTVVEVWPSAGWYTEVIAPYLNDSGQYISASFDVNTDNEYFGKMAKRFQNKLDEYPDLYGNVKHGVLEAPDRIEIAETNSIPAEILAKTLQQLASLNMVKSVKGARGGYMLSSDIDKVNIIDFIEMLEGPVGLTDCSTAVQCDQECCCTIKDPMTQINNKIISTLKNITLDQFTKTVR